LAAHHQRHGHQLADDDKAGGYTQPDFVGWFIRLLEMVGKHGDYLFITLVSMLKRRFQKPFGVLPGPV
jgi:hypothetical protein